MSRYFKSKEALQISLLMIVSVGIFCHPLPNDFIWDDNYLIANNRHIRDLGNLFLFFKPHYWNELHPFSGQYRPVRTVSFALDYRFWKLNPAGYLITNISLHTINVVLVFLLAVTIAGKEAAGAEAAKRRGFLSLAFVTALFFALHPIHSESIHFIKNRSDLLAQMFLVSAFLLFMRQMTATRRRIRRLLTAGAWSCFAAAMLSKETALLFPAVLILYAVCFPAGKERRRVLIQIAPYVVLVLAYFWFRQAFLRPAGPLPPGLLVPEGFGRQALTVIKTMGIYCRMLLVPVPLNIEHAFTIPVSPLDSGVLFALPALTLIGLVAVRALPRAGVVFFGINWMVLTLLPAANILYLASRPIAEQRLYIPSLGFCLLLGWGLERLSLHTAKKPLPVKTAVVSGLLTVIIAGSYGVITIRRNFDWRDAITLYSTTVVASPHSARIHFGLARALAAAGQANQARGHFLIALSLDPDSVDIHNDFGCFLADNNRPEEAVSHYLAALHLNPEYAPAHNNLGKLLFEKGRTEQAGHHFSAAVRIDPENAAYRNHLGMALFEAGRTREAVVHYLSALRLAPDNAGVHNGLGIALGELGRFEEAVDHFLTAIRLQPDNIQSLNNLGVALVGRGGVDEALGRLPADLLLRPDFANVYSSIGHVFLKKGELDKAARYFYMALGLTPDKGTVYYALGIVAAAKGDCREAATLFAKALRLTPNSVEIGQRYRECMQMTTRDDGKPDDSGEQRPPEAAIR